MIAIMFSLYSWLRKSILINKTQAVPVFIQTPSLHTPFYSTFHFNMHVVLFHHLFIFTKQKNNAHSFLYLNRSKKELEYLTWFGSTNSIIKSNKQRKTWAFLINTNNWKEHYCDVSVLQEAQTGQSHDWWNGSSPQQQREQRTIARHGGDERWASSASPTASYTH